MPWFNILACLSPPLLCVHIFGLNVCPHHLVQLVTWECIFTNIKKFTKSVMCLDNLHSVWNTWFIKGKLDLCVKNLYLCIENLICVWKTWFMYEQSWFVCEKPASHPEEQHCCDKLVDQLIISKCTCSGLHRDVLHWQHLGDIWIKCHSQGSWEHTYRLCCTLLFLKFVIYHDIYCLFHMNIMSNLLYILLTLWQLLTFLSNVRVYTA